jgi:hypothetical protein
MRRLIGILFLLAQCITVVYARFERSRWMAWAPNDYVLSYRLEVHINGRGLSTAEIERRYHLPAEQVYEFPAENIMDIVRQRERTYGARDGAQVLLTYRPDGGPAQEWRWPE